MKYKKLTSNITIREYSEFFNKQGVEAFLTTKDLNLRTTSSNYKQDLNTILNTIPTKKRRVFLDQVHGNKVIIDDGKMNGLIGQADGLISDKSDILLQTSHGDCFPIYATDSSGEYFGIAHSGREGTYLEIAKILVETLAKESNVNTQDIKVIVGAGIDVENYQVNKSLYDNFLEKFGPKSVKIKNNKYYLDLKETIVNSLLKSGIIKDNILIDQTSTYKDKLLHSHRRDNQDSGRMLAFIYKK